MLSRTQNSSCRRSRLPGGDRKRKKNGAFLVCGGTVGHRPLRGHCPKSTIENYLGIFKHWRRGGCLGAGFHCIWFSAYPGETTAFAGRCIVALAKDPDVMRRSGKILLTCDLANEYGLVDVDGRTPSNIRSVKAIANMPGKSVPWIIRILVSWLVPSFVKIPKWMLHLASNKF